MFQTNESKIRIIGLSAAKTVTNSVCKHLGIKPLPVTISHFADGEILVRPEVPVRNCDVTVIQSLSKPVNENIMELLIAIDSLKRASAKSINVIIPYYAYARQDRKTLGREPITSKLIASLLEKTGASRVSTIDIHSEQTQGFFDIPVDTLRATFLTVNEAIKHLNLNNLVVVSPDYGGIKRARSIANNLNVPLAILDKRRPLPNQAEIVNILGNVTNKDCLISDDMVDTAGTLTAACKILKKNGAKSITISATHGILSEPAVKRLTNAVKSKMINSIYLTNTIELVNKHHIPKLHVVDVGGFLADIIRVYYSDSGSISEVYSQYTPKIRRQ
jgi:ribose-phosphate pyrophosphokinase